MSRNFVGSSRRPGTFLFALAAVFTVVGLLVPGDLAAATKRERLLAADRLVKQALSNESYGQDSEREQLLKQALEQTPDHKPALWHSGHVKFKKRWVPADQVPAMMQKDSRMAAYHKLRDKHEETVEGQLAVAKWCGSRGLDEQERAHLTKVVELDANNAIARNRLGHRRVDGIWMSRTDVTAARDSQKQLTDNLKEWRGKVEQIRGGLAHRSLKRQEVAKSRLMEISDPEAIPAIEAMLSTYNEKTALLVVKMLGRMRDVEATRSLARHAIYPPWATVRDAAIVALKDKNIDHFVPDMLGNMYSQVQSHAEIVEGRNGRLIYRHGFYREGHQRRELGLMQTMYRMIDLGGGGGDALGEALVDMNARFQEREQAVAQQNERTGQLNERIGTLLCSTTEQVLPAQPQAWWAWWNQYNEVFVSGDKEMMERYQEDRVTIYEGGSGGPGGPSGPMDCLAAGTMVWTATGQVAIEKMHVGDLVLSQNASTGELAYKPVLSTTIRPPSELVRLKIGKEEITTSGGHLLWVSGEGWKRSRHLEEGNPLHQIHGTQMITGKEKGGVAWTYNLVVADFHTYFIGEGKILSHDNTIGEHTGEVVPGFRKK